MRTAAAALWVLLLVPAAVDAGGQTRQLPASPVKSVVLGKAPQAVQLGVAPASIGAAAVNVVPVTSQQVLERLPASALAPERVASEIAQAASVDDAMGRLTRLGLLSAGEAPENAGDRFALLTRLWDKTSPKLLEERLPVDRSWALPAIKAQNDGATYLVHPMYHGIDFAVNRPGILSLARQIEKSGGVLLSEQGMWAHFNFVSGKEFNDHAAADGAAPAALSYGISHVQQLKDKAARQYGIVALYTVVSGMAIAVLGLLGGVAGAAAAGVAAAAAFADLLTGGRVQETASTLVKSFKASRAGRPDLAAQLRRMAFALPRKNVDPSEVLRLTLPPGPGAAWDPFTARNDAMAQAARQEAMATGKPIHLLVGDYSHAAGIAWRLASPEGPDQETHVA